jgi:ADP-ribose pyrophosphatase
MSQNDIEPEIAIHEEQIYDGRVIKLTIADVRLPNGATSKRELVRHPGAVAIVALDAENQVLLVRQYRFAAQRVMTEIPAGTLKTDEDPRLCAERELQEETGYYPGKLESLGGMFVAPGYTTEYIHLFLATDLRESRLAMDDDEFIAVDRVSLADALTLIQSGDIMDGKSIAGLLKVARMRGI